jgi:hypothetical protein
MKQSIDQQKRDLETKLIELEPLIPSARQLQGYGITLDLMFPYMETIHEKAEAEKIDIRSAAYGLAQDLRDYRQLGSLRKLIEEAKQKLAVLDAFTATKNQAMSTIMTLQLNGFFEKEIIELVGLVSRWNKSWTSLGSPGAGQGNGRSSDMMITRDNIPYLPGLKRHKFILS